MKSYIINNEIFLIDYLINELKYSHKEAKKKLVNNQVSVNDTIITKYNYLLKHNDNLIIKNFNSKINDDIKIVYEDQNIIVVDKPANLLTISTLNEKEKTLYHIVSDYLKKKNKNSKTFIVHRLDKETSGIVMFAKSEKTKKLYQDNWNTIVKYRGYVAVVEGELKTQEDIITQYLTENDNYYIYPTNSKKGKKAITCYRVLKTNKKYSLLNIEIKTGRKNQIRVAMKTIGHPIVGDYKYGYAPRGFLINYYDTNLVKDFLNQLRKYYKKRNFIFIKFNPEIIIGETDKERKFVISYNGNVRIIDELKAIYDACARKEQLGICLDTCHISDSGVDLNKFDEFLDEFDSKIGIDKIKCIHINDSMNVLGSHKDRHANIGYGTIGFDTLINIIYNERLGSIPRILETPYMNRNTKDAVAPYKEEIEMIRNKRFEDFKKEA